MNGVIRSRIEQILRGEVPDGYKKTKVGIVPAEWAVCNMGDIYSERKESGDPSLPILTVSIHSGVSGGELDESELGKKVKRIEDKTQYLTAKKGDLVFNMMRAWQGAIGVVRANGLVSPAYIVAKPIVKFCSAFMEEYIKLPESINRLHRKSYGVTDFRLRLYWDSFIKVDCCLPPIPEQEKIAEILTAQDRVIELCEKKIEQLKKLKKVFLQKMIPRPGCTVPEWRFPEFTDAWEQRKLGELIEKGGSGGTPNTSRAEYYDGTIPFLSITDVTNSNGYIYDTAKHITEAGLNASVAWIVPAESVSLAMYASVGKVAILKQNTATSQAFFNMIIPDVSRRNYIYQYLKKMEEFNEWVPLISTGTQANLNAEKVKSLSMTIPKEIKEQECIGSLLNNLDNLITLHQRKCDEEKQKKKALMQFLLTGIVRT